MASSASNMLHKYCSTIQSATKQPQQTQRISQATQQGAVLPQFCCTVLLQARELQQTQQQQGKMNPPPSCLLHYFSCCSPKQHTAYLFPCTAAELPSADANGGRGTGELSASWLVVPSCLPLQPWLTPWAVACPWSQRSCLQPAGLC